MLLLFTSLLVNRHSPLHSNMYVSFKCRCFDNFIDYEVLRFYWVSVKKFIKCTHTYYTIKEKLLRFILCFEKLVTKFAQKKSCDCNEVLSCIFACKAINTHAQCIFSCYASLIYSPSFFLPFYLCLCLCSCLICWNVR